MVVDELLLPVALGQEREELDDIRVIVIELVARTVEAKHKRPVLPPLFCTWRDDWALVFGVEANRLRRMWRGGPC